MSCFIIIIIIITVLFFTVLILIIIVFALHWGLIDDLYGRFYHVLTTVIKLFS